MKNRRPERPQRRGWTPRDWSRAGIVGSIVGVAAVGLGFTKWIGDLWPSLEKRRSISGLNNAEYLGALFSAVLLPASFHLVDLAARRRRARDEDE